MSGRDDCPRCHGRGFCAVCDLGADATELEAAAPVLPTTTWVEECMAKQQG